MNRVKEFFRIDLLFVFKGSEQEKIAGHDTAFDGIDGSFFQLIGKVDQFIVAVELAAFSQRAGLCKDGCDGVGRGFFTL